MVKPRVGLRLSLGTVISQVIEVTASTFRMEIVETKENSNPVGYKYTRALADWAQFVCQRKVLSAIEKGTRLRYRGTDNVLQIMGTSHSGDYYDTKLEWLDTYKSYPVSAIDADLAVGTLDFVEDAPPPTMASQPLAPVPAPSPLPGQHSVQYRKRVLATGLTMEAAEELRKQRLYYYGERVEVV